jgi:hypothetical protein
MGMLDGIVTVVLYACYGVYVAMGLCMLVVGAVYMGDAGAVGTTGIWLCGAGFIMLVIGGLAIWANMKESWCILMVIELINVALFLMLYIVIVVAIMMATGTTDPIRRTTSEGWPDIKATLTLPGTDGTSDGIYCETQPVSSACGMYYAAAKSATSTCKMGREDPDVRAGLLNCTAILDYDKGGINTGGCSVMAQVCSQCEMACMEQQILDVKDAILPMSIVVFCVMGYLFVVTCINTIMSHHEELGEGGWGMLGLVMNGILALCSFILIVIGCIGAYNADDAGGDIPATMIVTILTGFALFFVSILVIVAVKVMNNTFMLRVGTGLMVFMCIFLTLMGLLLGISSGAVMEDMDYYYEVNYPKLRAGLEKADNSYCQMTKTQCIDLTIDDKPCPVLDSDGVEVEKVSRIRRKEVWAAQHAEAAKSAQVSIVGADAWLSPCKTTGICIYCDEFIQRVQTKFIGVYDKRVNSTLGRGHIEGEACYVSDSKTGCVEAAPLIDFKTSLSWDPKTKPSYKAPSPAGPLQTARALADALDNYTKAANKASPVGTYSAHRRMTNMMGKCELAIGDYVADKDMCPDPPKDATSFNADCLECSSAVGNKFNFVSDKSGKDYMKCANFVYGHVTVDCQATTTGTATCQEQFYGNTRAAGAGQVTKADALKHTTRFVNAALADDSRSQFCGYSDRACKAKIRDAIESSMATMGTFGAIFLVFFLAILFFTMKAISIFKGGDEDDVEVAETDDE